MKSFRKAERSCQTIASCQSLLAICSRGGDGGVMVAVRNDDRFLENLRRNERKYIGTHLTLLVSE
jgi:hypothetical protein